LQTPFGEKKKRYETEKKSFFLTGGSCGQNKRRERSDDQQDSGRALGWVSMHFQELPSSKRPLQEIHLMDLINHKSNMGSVLTLGRSAGSSVNLPRYPATIGS